MSSKLIVPALDEIFPSWPPPESANIPVGLFEPSPKINASSSLLPMLRKLYHKIYEV